MLLVHKNGYDPDSIARPKNPPGDPMTLGNMRALGVRGLALLVGLNTAVATAESQPAQSNVEPVIVLDSELDQLQQR
jgi:hypothetical protein